MDGTTDKGGGPAVDPDNDIGMATMTGAGPRILLVIGGGIAAYKSCELVRLIRKNGGHVTCVLTEGGAQFVTPMALAALSENEVHTTLWDLKNEVEMGHIQLSREADLVVVCPATANMLAKMSAGIADDLATTLVLATDKPVLAVPAMNVRMWQHEATQRNIGWLREAGVAVMEPDTGAMACGEFGPGRLPEPVDVWREIARQLDMEPGDGPAQEEVYEVEALEPEPEVEPPARGGLGGLLSSIIPRTTRRRSAEEIEADWEQPAEHEAADVSDPGEQDEGVVEEPPVPVPIRSRPRQRRYSRPRARRCPHRRRTGMPSITRSRPAPVARRRSHFRRKVHRSKGRWSRKRRWKRTRWPGNPISRPNRIIARFSAGMSSSRQAPRARPSTRSATSPTGRAGSRALPLQPPPLRQGPGSLWWQARCISRRLPASTGSMSNPRGR